MRRNIVPSEGLLRNQSVQKYSLIAQMCSNVMPIAAWFIILIKMNLNGVYLLSSVYTVYTAIMPFYANTIHLE